MSLYTLCQACIMPTLICLCVMMWSVVEILICVGSFLKMEVISLLSSIFTKGPFHKFAFIFWPYYVFHIIGETPSPIQTQIALFSEARMLEFVGLKAKVCISVSAHQMGISYQTGISYQMGISELEKLTTKFFPTHSLSCIRNGRQNIWHNHLVLAVSDRFPCSIRQLLCFLYRNEGGQRRSSATKAFTNCL